MTPTECLQKGRLALLLGLFLSAARISSASDGIWASLVSLNPAGPAGAGQLWSDPTRWTGNAIAGTAGTTTSPDTLSMNVQGHYTITLDDNYNIKNAYHNAGAHRHAIVQTNGASVLSLTSGGSTSGNGNLHYYTPIRLEGGSGGAYTLGHAGNISLYDAVSGSATAAGNYDLILGGTAVANLVDTSGSYIGSLSDGSAGGTLSVIKAGTGTWYLKNASTYTGKTTLREGSLRLGSSSAMGATSSAVELGDTLSPAAAAIELEIEANGTYTRPIVATTNAPAGTITIAVRQNRNPTWNGNLTLDRNIRFLNTNVGGLTFGGTLSGPGGFTKLGENRLTLSAANTFSGETVHSGTGQLRLNHLNALQNSTLDTGASGSQVVEFNVAGTYNLGGLKGSDDLAIGANTLSVGANNQSNTYSGVISGTSGKLTKVGTGTLFLNGTNTFTNVTTVVAGGIGGGGALAGNLVLNAGTRFDAVMGSVLTVSNLSIGANCTLTLAGQGVGVIIRYAGPKPIKFATLEGFVGRGVSYTTPGEITIIRAGTVIVLQ